MPIMSKCILILQQYTNPQTMAIVQSNVQHTGRQRQKGQIHNHNKRKEITGKIRIREMQAQLCAHSTSQKFGLTF